MIQLNKVSLDRSEKRVLTDIDLKVQQGQTLGIIGLSGSGKSTLLYVLAGILKPSQGSLDTGTEDLTTALVFQDHGLFPWKTVRQNIQLGRLNQAPDPQRLDRIIKDLSIGDILDVYPHQLSGGQSQRVAIARALYQEASLILMDEPTASLDEFNRINLRKTLQDLKANYDMTLVYVTHQLREALALCDQILILHEGQVKGQVDPRDFADERALMTYMREVISNA
ncbi:TPA: ABC transporter ATP-binding protein [Streptococcus suis]